MNDPCCPDLLQRLPSSPRKVVLLRASRIGDFVCATPAFRALRQALPSAEITLIAMPFIEELVQRSPDLDRYIAFPGFPGMAEQFFNARQVVTFWQQMQAEEFDLAVQMHGSGVYSNPFTLLLGAKVTAGFIRPEDPPGCLEAAFPMPQQAHEIRRLLQLTSFLGASPQGEHPEFPLWSSDRTTAATLLDSLTPPLLGLHPSAREITKQWAPERFTAVAQTWQQQFGGTVILLGSSDTWALAEQICQGIGATTVNLAGQTSLPVLGAAIARLALLITNDSGPAHMAYALDTPSITIFGSTDPAQWGQLNCDRHRVLVHPLPCYPCNQGTCDRDYLCLAGITVDQVREQIQDLVSAQHLKLLPT